MKKIFFLGFAFVAVLGSYALAQRPGINSTLQTVFAIPLDGSMRSYGAGVAGISPGASITDVFEICGSASTNIRVRKMEISGRATAVSPADVAVVKRSTANAGGTYTPVTPVAFDSTSSAATATLKAYGVVPTTLGTLTGALVQRQLALGNLTTGVGGEALIFRFAESLAEGPLVLRGTGQCLAFNLNSGSFGGNTFNFAAEWTEGE